MFADLTFLITTFTKRLRKSQDRAASSLDRLGALSSALVVAALSPSMAFAQAQPVLEEVVITSQKKQESLLDAAIDVSVFSGEDLEKYAVTDMSGVALVTPGLTFQNTGVWAQIYLRGVGTRVSQAGLDTGVAVYVDDRYVGRQSGVMFGMTDVNRIEVLKGPQGVLFGRNSTGGAIRVISNPVSDQLEGDITVGAGDYSYRHARGTINVPITDNFAIRASAQQRKRDGFKENIIEGGYDYDDLDQFLARIRARWDVTENVSIEVGHMFAALQDLSNMGAVSADSGIARGIAFGGITTTDRFKIASSTTGPDLNPDGPKHHMNSSSLRLDASFSAFDVAAYVTDASNNERRWGDYDGNSFNDIDVTMTENQSEETSAGIEISSNGTGPLSWIVGMNYFDQEVNYDFDLRIGAIGGGNVPASTGWGTYWLDTYGVFASVDYELSDAWTISVGGRYTKEEKDIYWRPSSTEYAQNQRITLAAALLPNEDGEEWSSFDPKVTLTYSFANGGIAYATYSTGFKSGGYNAPTRRGGEALDPEELDMIEFGYKADLTNNLRLTSSVFFYDYTGLQVTRAAKGTGTVTTENAADSSVKGIDFDLTWAATDNLTVRFGGEFLDAEYEDYETGGRVANTILTGDPTAIGYGLEFFNAEGHPLLRAADMSFFIAGNYEMGPVSVNLNYSWTDEYYFDFVLNPASDSLIQPSHGILNGRLTYAVSDDLSVSLWGKNMTDEIYLNDSVMAATNQRINYAHPRTWGADISYRF